MKMTIATVAASAALGLTLLAAGGTAPALADSDTDFVCYDEVQSNGSEDLVCVTVDDLKAECKQLDPKGVSDECAIVADTAVVSPLSATVGGATPKLKAADPAPERSINAGFTILAAR